MELVEPLVFVYLAESLASWLRLQRNICELLIDCCDCCWRQFWLASPKEPPLEPEEHRLKAECGELGGGQSCSWLAETIR